jgi:uncharacterized protein YggL (DUF469 family)
VRHRLRKKKHWGEYDELGFGVHVLLNKGVDVDAWLDDFLTMLERNGLECGGGIGPYNEYYRANFEVSFRMFFNERSWNEVFYWLQNEDFVRNRVLNFDLSFLRGEWHTFKEEKWEEAWNKSPEPKENP